MRIYDLKLVICTIAGVSLSGYGESDAVSAEWESDIVERTKTADGHVIYSRSNDREVMVTITLMRTSGAIPLLHGLIETQHQDNLGIALPVLAPLPFLLLDPATGDQMSGLAVFVARPSLVKGKAVGELEYRLSIAQPKYTMGPLNVLNILS